MLTITRSHDSGAATDYFTNGLSTEGYYLDDNIGSVWSGKTAALLDLEGEDVTKENFSNLVSNIHPITKEKLTVRHANNRRAGFDLTFSAVKSVSILYALTEDLQILEAHQHAYKKAMEAVEADMQTQANTKDKRIYKNTGNIIYAAFDHFTSRPNEIKQNGKVEFVSDPQLHTHCYIPNVTWNEDLQRYQAIEIGNLHRLAPFYEAIYHAHLSKSLNDMGLTVSRNNTRYEVAGITRKTIEKFSNRSATIEQIAKDKGITDAKTKSKLGATTRNSKDKAIGGDKLLHHWKNRLSDGELETIQSLKTRPQQQEKPITAKEAIDLAISHFEERQSAYQEKRVLAHALTLGYGHFLPDHVTKELNNRDNILKAEIDSVTYMTTHEMVRAEDRMIRLAVHRKGHTNAIHQNYKIKQDFLNNQQRGAIQKILQSYDGVQILKGAAGVGKTSLLTEVNTAVQEKGQTLIALAPSSQAAKQLTQKGFEADTIAGFLINSKKHERLKNNVLLIDEAGMVGVKTMSELLSLSADYNAKVILSGDTKQHNSIEFGDSLRILQDKAQLHTAQVSKIVRQQNDEYKKAVEKLAHGQVIEGYQALEKMDAIKEIPDHEKRIDAIANDYIQSIKNKKSALIISPTHHEGDLINNAVRQKLKQEKIIQGKEREFTTLKNLSFTESQKKDTKLYRDGQVVRFINNQKGGYKAGQHYEVMPPKPHKPIEIKNTGTGQILPLPHQTPEAYQVFDKTKTKLAKGDSIRLTQNSKSQENTKMNNGTIYKVEGFTRTGDLKLSNKKTLSKDNRHFKHAYSETSQSSQGKDAQHVYISMSDLSFAAASKQQFYVSVSRGTQKAHIYTSDKQELKKAIHRSHERITAKEIAKTHDHNKQLLQRQQREYHQSLNEKQKQKIQNRERDLGKRLEK
ncbi:MobF family relaxase [Tenacibaculum agarivorans]|uniref:MobF family relaxase n=1 Tax=Tenacibaculum agarivorans TaxID=1908389 RepID=UPI00094B97ED|nr:MobF family relaxase [Tenacibaculum agarivorans]